MRWLLDINVLIALLDPDHAFHDRAHGWWSSVPSRPWSSCPLTENGLIRIMASSAYPADRPFTIAELAENLRLFAGNTDHEFWKDTISVTDSSRFRHERILTSRHLTALYLLALAAENGGRLATFDQNIPLSSLPKVGSDSLEVLKD